MVRHSSGGGAEWREAQSASCSVVSSFPSTPPSVLPSTCHPTSSQRTPQPTVSSTCALRTHPHCSPSASLSAVGSMFSTIRLRVSSASPSLALHAQRHSQVAFKSSPSPPLISSFTSMTTPSAADVPCTIVEENDDDVRSFTYSSLSTPQPPGPRAPHLICDACALHV